MVAARIGALLALLVFSTSTLAAPPVKFGLQINVAGKEIGSSEKNSSPLTATGVIHSLAAIYVNLAVLFAALFSLYVISKQTTPLIQKLKEGGSADTWFFGVISERFYPASPAAILFTLGIFSLFPAIDSLINEDRPNPGLNEEDKKTIKAFYNAHQYCREVDSLDPERWCRLEKPLSDKLLSRGYCINGTEGNILVTVCAEDS